MASWQHHTSIQTFIDMFGKQQAERFYDEHIEELKRLSRQKLIDERLIPIVELLVTDQKTKLTDQKNKIFKLVGMRIYVIVYFHSGSRLADFSYNMRIITTIL